jgi:predicted AlkP superfamily phosphohydrolase/phosphomutase
MQEGRAWIARIPDGFGAGDDLDAPNASRLILYEDDRELGPSHAQHETIRQTGGGAYSHWRDSLYFSTSDGSDPRTNGRTYRIVLRSLKLMVIVVDGVDPETLQRYMDEGRLPNIGKVVRQSREVAVQTDCELFGVTCWPNFASGQSIGEHGIHGFLPLRSGTLKLVDSVEFQMPTPFWETAARAGISTCVLDMPHYPPPAAARGLEKLHYVEWGAHPPRRHPGSTPPELCKTLTARHGHHPAPIDSEAPLTVRASADQVACFCAGARRKAAVVNDLIRMTNPELMVAVFSEPHSAGHQFLHRETPGHPSYDPALVEALGSPTRTVCEAVDEAVGMVVDQLPADATVVLGALGGMRATNGYCYLLHDLLVQQGYTAYPSHDAGDDRSWRGKVTAALQRGRDVLSGKQSFESSPRLPFDWSKTQAFALPWSYEGYLRVNQKRREPGGIVDGGAGRERLLAEIESMLRSLRIAGTDEPAVESIIRTQEHFPGAASAELPDLFVSWRDDRRIDAIESDTVKRIENRDPARRSAHTDAGGVYAYGPLIAAGPPIGDAKDFDLAPTILGLLGVTPPTGLAGRALSGLIAPAEKSLPRRNAA